MARRCFAKQADFLECTPLWRAAPFGRFSCTLIRRWFSSLTNWFLCNCRQMLLLGFLISFLLDFIRRLPVKRKNDAATCVGSETPPNEPFDAAYFAVSVSFGAQMRHAASHVAIQLMKCYYVAPPRVTTIKVLCCVAISTRFFGKGIIFMKIKVNMQPLIFTIQTSNTRL